MTLTERLGLPVLRILDPERAHGLALAALRAGLGPDRAPVTTPRLATTLAGLDLPNPLGLAAGMDKNATAVAALGRAGFGFVEVGAATPRPQAGNPRPRLFRLPRDRAVINRFGFNNDGMTAIAARLAARPRASPSASTSAPTRTAPTAQPTSPRSWPMPAPSSTSPPSTSPRRTPSACATSRARPPSRPSSPA